MKKKPFVVTIEDADEHHAFVNLNGLDVAVIRPIVSDDGFSLECKKNHPLNKRNWQRVLNYLVRV